MASTGRTIAKAAALLHSAGGRDIYAVITHPLFCGDAEQTIQAAGIEAIWGTDSLNHHSAVIHLDALLAGAVKQIC